MSKGLSNFEIEVFEEINNDDINKNCLWCLKKWCMGKNTYW